MPEPTVIAESTWAPVALTDEQAAALDAAGRRLASKTAWWGHDPDHPADDTRSVIRTRRINGRWQMRVNDAVGTVAVGDQQIIVQPKIPLTHFLYLLQQVDALPRMEDTSGTLGDDQSLWELVARWYIQGLGTVLKLGVIRDYQRVQDNRAWARGTILPGVTARNYYSGNLALHCRYQDFTLDTPLNRVLAAAGRIVTADPTLPWDIRRRARRAVQVLADVSELQRADLRATTDRRTNHYRPALQLAHHVITRTGRTLEPGAQAVRTFLIRTPELVEAGVRAVLTVGLEPDFTVDKHQIVAGVSFEPDLVFAHGLATGDVKYKLHDGYWQRADLYQAIAFAAAFRTHHAAVIAFATTANATLADATPGQYRIRYITWPARVDIEPADAAATVMRRTKAWLTSCETPREPSPARM